MKCSIIAVLALALIRPTLGLASPPEAKAQAKAAYAEGVTAFRGEKFPTALTHFERAFKLDPAPVLLYNLARCHEELGDYPKAIEHYELYLTRQPQATDRVNVQERVRQMKIRQRRDASKARAAAEAREAAQRQADRDAATAALNANAQPNKAAPLDAGDLWGYGLISAGSLGIGLGIGMGVLAQSKAESQRGSTSQSRIDTLAGEAEDAQTWANTGYIAGGLLVAAGLTLVVINATTDGPAVTVVPRPGGATLGFGGAF